MIVIRLDFSDTKFSQAKHWCKQAFGQEETIDRKGRWSGTRVGPWISKAIGDSIFSFTDPTDAMAFKLVWGGK